MRASMRVISSLSPRLKNMPLLVRSGLSSSPPVWVCTVSERAMRGRAAAIRASHSSSLSTPPSTTTLGCVRVASTSTVRSPALTWRGDWLRSRSGTFTPFATRAPPCSTTCAASGTTGAGGFGCCAGRVFIRAWLATSRAHPADTMAARIESWECPAAACSRIHCRNSMVMIWLMSAPGASRTKALRLSGRVERPAGRRRTPPARIGSPRR